MQTLVHDSGTTNGSSRPRGPTLDLDSEQGPSAARRAAQITLWRTFGAIPVLGPWLKDSRLDRHGYGTAHQERSASLAAG